MEYFNYKDYTVFLFSIDEAGYNNRWAILSKNNEVVSAQVVAPISKELGSNFDLNYLDEENIQKLNVQRVNSLEDNIINKVTLVKRVLAGRNRFKPQDPLERLFFGGGLRLRDEMIKAHLGIGSGEEEYSRRNIEVVEDNNLNCIIKLNYAQEIVEIEFSDDKDRGKEDTNGKNTNTNNQNSGKISISKPNKKFNG